MDLFVLLVSRVDEMLVSVKDVLIPDVLNCKPLCGFMVNLAFHPAEVGQMSTRNSWELKGAK